MCSLCGFRRLHILLCKCPYIPKALPCSKHTGLLSALTGHPNTLGKVWQTAHLSWSAFAFAAASLKGSNVIKSGCFRLNLILFPISFYLHLFLFASLSIPMWDVFRIITKSLFPESLFLVFCQSERSQIFCSLALSNIDKYCYLDMFYPKCSHSTHPQSIWVLHRNHQKFVSLCNIICFVLFCFCFCTSNKCRESWVTTHAWKQRKAEKN